MEGDQQLQGYDGDTGVVVYDGGGSKERMCGTHSYSTTGIVAQGHIYVAGDNKAYAFIVPPATPTPRPKPAPRLHPTHSAAPDAITLMRLTEEVRRLGFAPVQAGKSTRDGICSL